MRPNTEGRLLRSAPQLSGTDSGVSWLIRIRWLTNDLIHNAPDNHKKRICKTDALLLLSGVSNEISYAFCTRQNLLVQDNAPLAILAFSDRHLVGLG